MSGILATDSDRVEWVRRTCLAMPSATTDTPFGPGAEVFRIHRKIFALLSEAPRLTPHPVVNVKADPQEVPLLVSTHAWILPGYHQNKRHWVSLVLGPDLGIDLASELVEDSYDLVVLGLPARLRPVTPDDRGSRSAGGRTSRSTA